MAIKVFECLQFFYECLILVLKDSDSVFKTLDILLLLPPTLFRSLSVKVTMYYKKWVRNRQIIDSRFQSYMKTNSSEHNIDKNHGWKE